jgi:hypothetical protein
MWVIILTEDGSVVCAQKQKPPQKLFDSPHHEVFEWFGEAPQAHDPDEGAESYDPRPVGYDTHKVDFEGLSVLLDTEIAYLDSVIDQIDLMNQAQLAAVIKRLAQENKKVLAAFKYVASRFS